MNMREMGNETTYHGRLASLNRSLYDILNFFRYFRAWDTKP